VLAAVEMYKAGKEEHESSMLAAVEMYEKARVLIIGGKQQHQQQQQ
jgi:hypothetical protein